MFRLTKAISKKLENTPLYSKDGQGKKAEVIVKFFLPCSGATWLITEAEKQENGDYLMYGYSYIHEWEWGYINLSDLKKLKVHGIFTVEIDKHLEKHATVEDCVNYLGY